jgi:hypothetical protein
VIHTVNLAWGGTPQAPSGSWLLAGHNDKRRFRGFIAPRRASGYKCVRHNGLPNAFGSSLVPPRPDPSR